MNFWLRIVLGTIIIALASPHSFNMPGYVPITLQSLAVILTPMIFGWRSGVISIFIYLVLGAIGLPVFANFSSGLDPFYGKTVGFLLGFLPAGFVAGWWAEKCKVQYARYFFIFIGAHLVLMLCGVFGLLAHGLTFNSIWEVVLYLFPGLMIKSFFGAILVLIVKIKTTANS